MSKTLEARLQKLEGIHNYENIVTVLVQRGETKKQALELMGIDTASVDMDKVIFLLHPEYCAANC